MRKEFLLLNGVTVNEYMEEATKWLRSMKLGEVLADGRCLASDLTEAEQKELSDYIYEIAYEEMIRTAGKHSLYKCDFGEYSDDLIGNFSEVLMKRLHTFNDKAHLKNDDKKYCFSTFLDELSKDAIRMTYAQKRGVSEHVEQRIQNVRQAFLDFPSAFVGFYDVAHTFIEICTYSIEAIIFFFISNDRIIYIAC